MKSGIYKITNLIDGKIYIGSTCDFKSRKSKHKTKKSNTLISRAIHKYGWENFKFEILEYCEREVLLEREQFYIDDLQPFKENNGYNLLRNVLVNGWVGHTHTEEAKKKMSELKMGNYIPWNKGKVGVQICSNETKQKMSEIRKGDGNSFYNKKHSDESLKKMSESHKKSDMTRFFKKILQIDKNTNEVIKIWNSISDAAEYLTNDRSQGTRISKVCNGKYKTSMGYIWRYLEVE